MTYKEAFKYLRKFVLEQRKEASIIPGHQPAWTALSKVFNRMLLLEGEASKEDTEFTKLAKLANVGRLFLMRTDSTTYADRNISSGKARNKLKRAVEEAESVIIDQLTPPGTEKE